MEIVAYDRTGIMAEIMAALAELKISILSINAKTSDTKNVVIHMASASRIWHSLNSLLPRSAA